jgi:hypothetical protein
MEHDVFTCEEKQELEDLYNRLGGGDAYAVDRWCELCKKMTEVIAGKMDLTASAYPGDVEDLRQDGDLAAFETASDVMAGRVIRENVAGYMWTVIWHEIVNKVQGKKGSFRLANMPKDYDALVEQSQVSEVAAIAEANETREHLLSLCTSSVEQEIVNHGGEDKPEDIAEKLGIEYRRVLHDRHEFMKRVDSAYWADGEGWKLGKPKQGCRPKTPKAALEWKAACPLKPGRKDPKRSPLSASSKPADDK